MFQALEGSAIHLHIHAAGKVRGVSRNTHRATKRPSDACLIFPPCINIECNSDHVRQHGISCSPPKMLTLREPPKSHADRDKRPTKSDTTPLPLTKTPQNHIFLSSKPSSPARGFPLITSTNHAVKHYHHRVPTRDCLCLQSLLPLNTWPMRPASTALPCGEIKCRASTPSDAQAQAARAAPEDAT